MSVAFAKSVGPSPCCASLFPVFRVSLGQQADQMAFQLYKGGVLSKTCGTKLDHGVLVVGYGTEDGKDYWLVKNSWGSTWGFDEYAFPWPKCLHRVLKVKDIIGGECPRGDFCIWPLGVDAGWMLFALCEMIVFFCSDSFAKLSVRWGMSLVPALLFALLITRVASRWQCVPSVVGEAWRVAIDRPACQAKKKFKSFVPAARTVWAASFVGKRRVKWGRWKRRRLRRRWTLLLREGGHGLMLPNVRRHAQREDRGCFNLPQCRER